MMQPDSDHIPERVGDRNPAVRGIEVLMTRREVAMLLRVSQSSLSRWARDGVGPPCVWLAPTAPRYRRAEVLAWLEQQSRAA